MTRTRLDEAAFSQLGLGGAWQFFSERFSPAGRWFALATIAWFLSGINSLDLQAYVPLLYAFAFWILAVLAVFWVRPRVELKAQHIGRVCAGETLPIETEVTYLRGNRAENFRVLPFRLPTSLQALPPGGAFLPAGKAGEKVRLDSGVLCRRRGVYRVPGFRVETDFPFGILRASQTFTRESSLLVLPKFAPLSSLEIPRGRRHHPGGVALATHGGESFEFLGNRDYRSGDAVRDIDWRATARLQRPVVREFREEYFLRVAVVLDTHIPQGRNAILDDGDDAFEHAVSQCAAIADFLARSDYIVDILAAGPNLYHLTTGRSGAYLDQILDILACVEVSRDAPFEILEPEIAENLAQINTVIFLFLDWDETRRAFVERLEQSGAGLKIIIVRDEPCTIDPTKEAQYSGVLSVFSSAQCAAGIANL